MSHNLVRISLVAYVLLITNRLLPFDDMLAPVWANSFFFYLLVPAYPIVVFGLIRKDRVVIVVSGSIVLFHLWVVGSPYLANIHYSPPPSSNTAIRVYSANLMMGPLAEEDIRDANPDIVLFQEFTKDVETHHLNDFPHQFRVPRSDAFGIAIFSRYPLQHKTTEMLEGVPLISAQVKVHDQTLTIFNVHTLPPLNSDYLSKSNTIFTRLGALIKEHQGPMLMAGDFNVTQYGKQHAKLVRLGLQSAHQVTGRDYANTFPNGRWWLPPIRLDHMFISAGLSCTSVFEGNNRGSDHKPLVADIFFSKMK